MTIVVVLSVQLYIKIIVLTVYYGDNLNRISMIQGHFRKRDFMIICFRLLIAYE